MATDRQTAQRIDALTRTVEELRGDAPVAGFTPAQLAAAAKLLRVTTAGVERLEAEYTREELDAIAAGAGVDDPDKLPNKRVVAEHAYDALVDSSS